MDDEDKLNPSSEGMPRSLLRGSSTTNQDRGEKMRNHLTHIIEKITADHADNIDDASRHYLEVSIAEKAAKLGLIEGRDCYKNANAIVPLKSPVEGMKVRIDGRTFVNYVQFASGIAVPNYVARQTDLPHRAYVPQDSMILNFT